MSELYGPLEPWQRDDKHTLRALENRAGPFQQADTARILSPLTDLMQEVEDVFWGIFEVRFLENATGDALDILGAIVGEQRLDDTEEEYKLRIRLKLRAINSQKKARDFIELLALLEGSTWYLSEAPGWVLVSQVAGPAVNGAHLLRLLEITSADGVIVRLETYGGGDPADLFFWPSQDGSIDGGAWASQDGTIDGSDWFGRF